MMNRDNITYEYDGYVARFHAIEKSGVSELDMFIMPISDAFLPWLVELEVQDPLRGVRERQSALSAGL